MNVTGVYDKNRRSLKRIVVNEGGARSSKTYSILQLFITIALSAKELLEFDIVRQTFPALRATAMKDFFQIISSLGLYNEEAHDKTNHTYTLNGCLFSFYSIEDNAQKIRGRKRHYILMNEANEMSLETFVQVEMRTEVRVFLDYNPSEVEHWIYERVIPRPDCEFIHSTYLDNPFLVDAIVKSIEGLRSDDDEYWKIYGLGQRGRKRGVIFTNWDIVPDESVPLDGEVLYGMDLGYNDPKVLVRLTRKGREIWVEELLYQPEMIRPQLIEAMKQLVPDRVTEIISDNDPEAIEEIYSAGFNIFPAEKEQESVATGSAEVKAFFLDIT